MVSYARLLEGAVVEHALAEYALGLLSGEARFAMEVSIYTQVAYFAVDGFNRPGWMQLTSLAFVPPLVIHFPIGFRAFIIYLVNQKLIIPTIVRILSKMLTILIHIPTQPYISSIQQSANLYAIAFFEQLQ